MWTGLSNPSSATRVFLSSHSPSSPSAKQKYTSDLTAHGYCEAERGNLYKSSSAPGETIGREGASTKVRIRAGNSSNPWFLSHGAHNRQQQIQRNASRDRSLSGHVGEHGRFQPRCRQTGMRRYTGWSRSQERLSWKPNSQDCPPFLFTSTQYLLLASASSE